MVNYTFICPDFIPWWCRLNTPVTQLKVADKGMHIHGKISSECYFFLSQCKSSVSLQLQFPVFTEYIHVYIYKISQSLLILSHLALNLECIAIKPPWIAAMVYYQIWILFSFCTLDYLFLCYQICRIYSHLISLTLLQTPLPQPPLKKKIKNH